MTINDYHFVTHWRLYGSIEEIADILCDAPDLARWWPSVYLDVQELEAGDADGIGKVVSLFTTGWLPYTLHWQFRVVETNFPHGFTIEAWGDFSGRGIWTLRQDGDWADIHYDWRIRANKPLLRTLSFLLKPLFSANHYWAMGIGLKSLELELDRRQAPTPAEQNLILPPPGPTFRWPRHQWVFIIAITVTGFLVGYLLGKRSKSKPR